MQYYYNKFLCVCHSKVMLGVFWTIMCVSCKSVDKPVKQPKIVAQGLELKCSLQGQESYELEP